MKIKLLVALSGAVCYLAGDTAEFSDNEAIRLIQANYAEPLDKKEFEKALKAKQEDERQKQEAQNLAEFALYEKELKEEKKRLSARIKEIDEILKLGKKPDTEESQA